MGSKATDGDLHARSMDMERAASLCGLERATVTAAGDNKIGVTCKACLKILGLDKPVSAHDLELQEIAEVEELRRFRREVLLLSVPQWRRGTMANLLDDLRALLGTCAECGHLAHSSGSRPAPCPTLSKKDETCECHS